MKRYLQYNWWKYIAIVLLPILLWCTVFDLLDQPEKNETLRIVYVGKNLDTVALQQALEDVLPELTQQDIAEITVTQSIPSGVYYFDFLMAQSIPNDIIIIPQSQYRDNIGAGAFSRLSEALMDDFDGVPLYTETVEDTALAFGFVLYDGTGETRFSSFCTEPEVCYLFPSPESVNFAGKNGAGNACDDAAIKAIEYLLEVTP